MDSIATEALLRLPPDELAILRFLSAQAGDDGTFIATFPDLMPKLKDCSSERLRMLVKRLERKGFVERQRLCHAGTAWTLLHRLDEPPQDGGLFQIPQNKPKPQYVQRRATFEVAAISPMGVPARPPTVFVFPRDQECDLNWNVWDSQREPVRDCVVRASLLYGRSQFGAGGTAVFNNRLLQHCGDGLYTCRIKLSAQVAVATNYVTIISAKRNGKPFGYWEEPSSVEP